MPETWEGPARDLERLLKNHGSLGGEARGLLSWSNATGTFLGELRKSHPLRVTYRRTNSGGVWNIKP